MRGEESQQAGLFSYVSLESRIPKKHPLRKIRALVDAILGSMDSTFAGLYSDQGRASIPPERLLRASLLQVLYSIRSERALMERLDFDLLFRWFVGLNIDEPVWDRTTFSQNRERLLNESVLREFFDRIVLVAEWKRLSSNEHFSVDGTLIDAWASPKSFKPKDGRKGPGGGKSDGDFKGESRSNKTHESTTDPDSRLYKKARFAEAKLRYMTHTLMENRSGLIVDVETTRATGKAEREAAVTMVKRKGLRVGSTLAADKGYDAKAFLRELRSQGIRPHIAARKTGSALDARTTRHATYAVSLKCRKMIEESFGWAKTVGGFRKTRFKGLSRVSSQSLLTFAAYNLTRMSTLWGWAPKASAV